MTELVTAPAETPAPSTSVERTSSAISIRDVSKTFRIPHERFLTLKERALHPIQAARAEHDELRAVDHVSVDIREGEFFGIVGRNGSGKSTLLKCVAGIYDIDSGEIAVRGRLSPFIELGVGFNPDLTARDNVLINAVMLGLTRKQARERFDEIIAFAELEEFVDLRLKNYSSGMNVRLAFAVAIQVDADILLIDEILAVGDASFQQKCFDEFHRLRAEGRTIIFVTHDMYSLQRYCDRVMLIERGRVLTIDDPTTVSRQYNELNFGRPVHELAEGDDTERFGDQREAEIRECWFENAAGERIGNLAQGERCVVCVAARFHVDIEDPVFGVALLNEVGITVFATSTDWSIGPTGAFRAGQDVVVRIAFDNILGPSRYAATPSIARAGTGADALDMREGIASLIVFAPRFSGGAADIPHEIEIVRE